jgi:hypothetical protein
LSTVVTHAKKGVGKCSLKTKLITQRQIMPRSSVVDDWRGGLSPVRLIDDNGIFIMRMFSFAARLETFRWDIGFAHTPPVESRVSVYSIQHHALAVVEEDWHGAIGRLTLNTSIDSGKIHSKRHGVVENSDCLCTNSLLFKGVFPG